MGRVVRCSPSAALLVVPQQRLVKIHGQVELIHADVLIFAVDRGVLLAVDINGCKADDGVRKVGKAAGIRAGRQDKGCYRRVGKCLFCRAADVLIADTVKGGRPVVLVFPDGKLHIMLCGDLAQGL